MNAARRATQANRQVQIGSPLGPDDLLFRRMTMTEGVSRLFEIEVEAYSYRFDIAPRTMLGGNVTISYQWYPDGPTRHFNGYVRRFGLAGGRSDAALYRFTLVPHAWLLTQTVNSRIFEEISPSEIIAQILREHHVASPEVANVDETYEYCVQYQESDFAFISRLMERHGLFFYFTHENGAHRMHVVPGDEARTALDCHAPFPVRLPGRARAAEMEYAEAVEATDSILPNKVAMQDYDFTRARAALDVEETRPAEHEAGDLRVYEYPGRYDTTDIGRQRARIAAEGFQARRSVITGRGTPRGVSAGHVFEINEEGATLITGRFLALECALELEQGGFESGDAAETSFSCAFTAIPEGTPYRPPRETPRPVIHGAQTAVVVNRNGQELDVDEYGRVRVRFRWDQEAADSMPCRVSQLWAGARWGGAAWPRAGQEVIVEFLDGDPDRPIITGRVYNSASMPPFNPESDADVFTIMSRTVGGDGFNELQFRDTAGEEHVFLHAQKDLHVRIGEKRIDLVGTEEHRTVVESAFADIGREMHQTVGSDRFLTVSGASHRKVGMDDLVKADMNMVHQAGINVHIKGGANVVVEAGGQMTLKAGGSFVTIGPAGVDISGAMVKINSGGAAGSGAGTAPNAAEAPLEPREGEPGIAQAPPPPPLTVPPREALESNPVSRALLDAAQSGAPFCAICEKERAERGG